MEPTIDEINESLKKLMSEADPPLRIDPREQFRETAPEIQSSLAQTIKNAALLVAQKRANVSEWKNGRSSSGEVFDHRYGGVGETINGLELQVWQRSDSSITIDIFDEVYADANLHKDIPDREIEVRLLDTNSRGEVISFLPDHAIYERIGISKDEFAHLVAARLEGMASKIEQQVNLKQEQSSLDSLTQVDEGEKVELVQENSITVSTQDKIKEEINEVPILVDSSSNSWIELLRSKLDNLDGSKLQVFSGASKVYEQNNNEVTLDNLDNALGQKVQQALENPTDLKGSVRILLDGEKIYHAKGGEVLENKYSLSLKNKQLIQTNTSDISLEEPQAIEIKQCNISITQETELEVVSRTSQVIEIEQQDNSITESIRESDRSVLAEVEVISSISQTPQEIVSPGTEQQITSSISQTAKLIDSQANEKAIYALIARQEARIEQLEQKLAAQTQPLNAKLDQWLNGLNQTAKEAVKEVKARSLHIPANVRQFLADKSNQIQASIKEQIKTTRTEVVNKVNEQVSAVHSEVVSKVNEVKSGLERKLADVAGTTLSAGTRYLAERFGVDNGAGIKVFQGNTLIITSSREHSGIYSKDGKQLVRDGQFISPVTSEQLNKIAQVHTEAKKLSQVENQTRAKALR